LQQLWSFDFYASHRWRLWALLLLPVLQVAVGFAVGNAASPFNFNTYWSVVQAGHSFPLRRVTRRELCGSIGLRSFLHSLFPTIRFAFSSGECPAILLFPQRLFVSLFILRLVFYCTRALGLLFCGSLRWPICCMCFAR
jgi:hypothetical protein